MTQPTPSTSPRIFVSHSHADNAYCREFVRHLRGALGGDDDAVWYDEDNLGWGALRLVIDRELQACQHFIAILSPVACASEWVNAEIDAALYLLNKGSLRTFLLVTAERCSVSPLLQRYRRIEHPDGSGYDATEAVSRVLPIVRPATRSAAPAATAAEPAKSLAHVLPLSSHPVSVAPAPSITPEYFPERFATLGFVARKGKDPQTGKEIALIVPPTVSVPAGPFQYGEGPASRTIPLPDFSIARYPVTVAEYACFLRTGQQKPPGWQDQIRHKLDHPVVSVSWHDATIYAVWLARLSGQPWRLPSEEEWEKAACWDPRSGASRVYPWGGSFDQSRCNTRECGIGTTTPVGTYGASGASLVGAEDMAGNVWEWTASLYDNSTDNRVLRGGSWYDGRQAARAAGRYLDWPVYLRDDIGFRVVLADFGS